MSARFRVARNPDAESRLPYLVWLPIDGGLVLKAREMWPHAARVFCAQDGTPWDESWGVGRQKGHARSRRTCTAVIIQPATVNEVAPLVALAYGLSERECQLARLWMHGQSTKQMAVRLGVSPYTIQDHLKSIFDKTGVRSRGELVGQVFLEHYVTRWDELADPPSGWFAKVSPTPHGADTLALAGQP